MTLEKPDKVHHLDLVSEYEQALAGADDQLLHELMQSIDDLLEMVDELETGG